MNHLTTSEVSAANQIGAPRDPLKSKSLIIKLHKCDDPNDDLKKTRKYLNKFEVEAGDHEKAFMHIGDTDDVLFSDEDED